MKKIILFMVVLIGTSIIAFAQEASVDYWQKGHGMTFLLKTEDAKCMIYFPPKGNYVEMELTQYAKSSQTKSIVFTPRIEGDKINLYIKDEVYFGHILFYNDCAYVYNTKGEYEFKIPRWHPRNDS